MVAVCTAVSALALAGACTSGSEDYSVASMLEQLPPTQESEEVLIFTADVAAAEEANGVERPEDTSDPGAVARWGSELMGYDDPDVPVFVPFGEGLGRQQLQSVDEFEEELGWSAIDVDMFVENSMAIRGFLAAHGDFDDETLADDLEAVDDEIVSAGTGDDFEMTATRTTARPMGVPLRLAQRDGWIASSASTPLVRHWLSGEGTMADDEQLVAVAEALDDQDAVSAVIAQGVSVGEAEQAPEIAEENAELMPEAFSYVGVGWTVEDGEGRLALAYSFESDEAAEASIPVFEAQYSDGLLQGARPMAELFSLASAEAEGNVTVLVVDRGEGVRAPDIMELLIRRELPVLHR